MDLTANARAIAKVDELQRLVDHRTELLRSLRKSLLLQSAWPEAFSDGLRCSVSLTGRNKRWKLTLRREDGVSKEWSLVAAGHPSLRVPLVIPPLKDSTGELPQELIDDVVRGYNESNPTLK